MSSTAEKYGFALGRVLISVIFILSGIGKLTSFAGTAAMMSSVGIPLAKLALVITLFVEIGGGLMLLTGFGARYAAIVMALWLIPVTLTFHNFWAFQGAVRMEQTINFLKNLAIMGGLIAVASKSHSVPTAKGVSGT